jgi:hypothetical protein
MRALTHKRALIVMAGAIGLDCLGGLVFALTEHYSVFTGLYWAVTVATTAGGPVQPRNATGEWVHVLVMLTVIPLFAATFSLITSGITGAHVKKETDSLHDCLDSVQSDQTDLHKKVDHAIINLDGVPNEVPGLPAEKQPVAHSTG